jgi:hypothetical protein
MSGLWKKMIKVKEQGGLIPNSPAQRSPPPAAQPRKHVEVAASARVGGRALSAKRGQEPRVGYDHHLIKQLVTQHDGCTKYQAGQALLHQGGNYDAASSQVVRELADLKATPEEPKKCRKGHCPNYGSATNDWLCNACHASCQITKDLAAMSAPPEMTQTLPCVPTGWTCPVCTFENAGRESACEMCKTPKEETKIKQPWQCKFCNAVNHPMWAPATLPSNQCSSCWNFDRTHIESLLQKHGKEEEDVRGDGDCQLHAIGIQVSTNAQRIREDTIRYVEEDPLPWIKFMGKEYYMQWIEAHRGSKTWCDDSFADAVAQMLGRRIEIWEYNCDTYIKVHGADLPYPIIISYNSLGDLGGHYKMVVPLEYE